MRVWLAAIFVSASLANAGCALALMAPVVVEGVAYPVERVEELRSGMTPVDVEAILGLPLTRQGRESELWRYDVTKVVRECRVVVGPFRQAARTERTIVEVAFNRDGVARVDLREMGPEMHVARVIVGMTGHR